MGISDQILNKKGKLTEEEFDEIKKHPILGYNLLKDIRYLQKAMEIPYYHHEKWDGSGYPRGLKEDQIPLPARIFAVVDVWDALNSDRSYRKAWPEEEVIAYMQAQSGKHFDPEILEAFFEQVLPQNSAG